MRRDLDHDEEPEFHREGLEDGQHVRDKNCGLLDYCEGGLRLFEIRLRRFGTRNLTIQSYASEQRGERRLAHGGATPINSVSQMNRK